jgi:hypothetical protein
VNETHTSTTRSMGWERDARRDRRARKTYLDSTFFWPFGTKVFLLGRWGE